MAYHIAPAREFIKATKHLKKHAETNKQLMLKIQRISEDPYGFGHSMSGKYRGLREAHLQNYLIIYRINENSKTVELVSCVDHDVL